MTLQVMEPETWKQNSKAKKPLQLTNRRTEAEPSRPMLAFRRSMRHGPDSPEGPVLRAVLKRLRHGGHRLDNSQASSRQRPLFCSFATAIDCRCDQS